MGNIIGLSMIVLGFCFTGSVLAGDKPIEGPDAKVQVQAVHGSKLDISEKWVDAQNGVVCYVLHHHDSYTGSSAMSCVKVANAK